MPQNPAELRAVRKTSPICRPMNTAPDGLILNGSKWTFTGTAMLVCPVPLSEIRASTDAPGNYIESFRLMYKDSDGLGTNTRLTTELRSPTQFLNSSYGPYYNSNTSAVTGLWSVTNVLNTPLMIKADQYLFVRVTLSKGPAFGQIEFYGISFP